MRSMTFPGFMMFLGSTAVLIVLKRCIDPSPTSFLSSSFFPVPTPCSPVQVPPKAMAFSPIQSACECVGISMWVVVKTGKEGRCAVYQVLGGCVLLGVLGLEEDEHVEVAVSRVCEDGAG